MQIVGDYPNIHKFVANIVHKTKDVKREYYDRVIGEFVDQYLLVDGDAENVRQQQQLEQRARRVVADHSYCSRAENLTVVPSGEIPEEDEDRVLNYGLRVLESVMLILQLKDTSREGDGTRASVNEKVLMSHFKSQNTYSKYALEMLTSVAQKELILSPRLAEVVRRERFVNWRGGAGNNMDDDTAIEICNCLTKSMVRDMGANKTEHEINMVPRASVGIKNIISNFDDVSHIVPNSSKHTVRSSYKDELNMTQDLRKIRPFRRASGRQHPSFPTISKSALSGLNMEEYCKWVKKHVKQLTSGIEN